MSDLRNFILEIPQAELDDLHTRLRSTRWLQDSFDGDWAYGAPLPFVRELCAYWLEGFDWRAVEAKANSHRQCLARVDGLDVHAMYRQSSHPDAIPLLLLHGWPSSCLDFLDLLEPLAEPPVGQPAFHPVAASLPGYAFSTSRPGMTPQAMAPILVGLMEQLGYQRFAVQGGDWGSLVGTELARQFPERVIGLHLNLVNGSPPEDPDALPLDDEEKTWTTAIDDWRSYPHLTLQSQKPASLSHALNDSPAGLAAWIGEKLHDWTDNRDGPAVSPDQMLANIALYWFSGCAGSASRLYYEMAHNPVQERYVTVPTAGAIFPLEVVKLPRAWAERHYNIVQWTVYERGGHFPAWEQPAALLDDLRRFAAHLQANH
ncbi:epoxide hydrolase [Mangrovimicrobium sediminis]|uniref:Epoxide hydrolase n=1 Tax=Mangrovimicrobium sediminis TaxID=2562682 RepID=A0A4Z0LVZ1_9GAMM|nr:epoxide hydrolase family protein [Haliea sp. SAOS-164]TGD71308.1 epoxide hydrolase [Haliea sp. SAOS-164]